MRKIYHYFAFVVLFTILYASSDFSLKKISSLKFDGQKSHKVGEGFLDSLKYGSIEVVFYYRGGGLKTLFSASSETSLVRNLSINIVQGKIQYYDRANSSSFTSTTVLEKGKFYSLKIAFTKSGPKMYIDGVLENSKINFQDKSEKIGWFSDILNPFDKNSYQLGAFKRPGEEKRRLVGEIRELKIYNEEELVVHYDFDNSAQSFPKYFKNIFFNPHYNNQANSNGDSIPFSEAGRENILFLIYALVSGCLLLLVFYLLEKKGAIFLTPKNYIKGFDGMRGISILLVFITHLGLLKFIQIDNAVDIRLKNLFSGTTGVNVFFTLSGFLITTILLKERQKKGNINFKLFYIKRFLRLLPTLILFLCALLLLMYFGYIVPNYKSIAYSFFYVSNYIPKAIYTSEIAATWSLSVEEQFYIIWPLTIYLFRKNRNLLIFIFVVITICLFFLLARRHSFFLNLIDFMNYGELSGKYYTVRWLIPAISTILMGCLVGIVSFNRGFMSKLKTKPAVLLVIGIILMANFLFIPPSIFILGWFIQSIGTSILILYILLNQESKFVALMEYKPIASMGKISYGLYIYQGLFLGTGPVKDGMVIQQYPLNILLTFLVAILSYVFIEKRFLLLKKKFD